METINKDIYKMEMHDVIDITERVSVFRVPGGWIYTRYFGDQKINSNFIPYDNEFMTEWERKNLSRN